MDHKKITTSQINAMSIASAKDITFSQANELISLYIGEVKGIYLSPDISSNIELGEKACTIATNYFKKMADEVGFSGSFISFSL